MFMCCHFDLVVKLLSEEASAMVRGLVHHYMDANLLDLCYQVGTWDQSLPIVD
jgi:hypothetical protein